MAPARPALRRRAVTWRLYWVSTEDGHEDLFVVAREAIAAARFHEREQGYNRGDARAMREATVPERAINATQYPGPELLVACGAEILRGETPRVVKLNGRQFVEGGLQHVLDTAMDDLFEERGDGRLNRTRRQGRPS